MILWTERTFLKLSTRTRIRPYSLGKSMIINDKHTSRMQLACNSRNPFGHAQSETDKAIEYSKNKTSHILKTKLDVECPSTVSSKHVFLKRDKHLRQNQNTLNGLSFGPLEFLQGTFLLNTRLEYSRSDLVFKQFRLHIDQYFMLSQHSNKATGV